MGSGEENESRRGRGLRAGPGILDESLGPHRCATASAVRTLLSVREYAALFRFAHQEHLSEMLRILGQIEKRGREIPARDMVRTVREVLPARLTSDAACRPSVREVGRTDDGPIEAAGGDQSFHPGEVGVWLPKDPADQVDQDPRAAPFDGGNAHGDDAPHARFPHGRELGTCHVADDGRWSAAFRGHNRDHCVLPADRTSDVLEVSTVSVDYHPQSRDIGHCVGTTRERSHRMSTPDAFFEYEATRATC